MQLKKRKTVFHLGRNKTALVLVLKVILASITLADLLVKNHDQFLL